MALSSRVTCDCLSTSLSFSFFGAGARTEEGKEKKISLCPLGTQPPARKNSVFDERHNKGWLRAVPSRQGLVSSLGKAPQPHILKKPLHAFLSDTIPSACFSHTPVPPNFSLALSIHLLLCEHTPLQNVPMQIFGSPFSLIPSQFM